MPPSPLSSLSTHHVQTIVPEEVHKTLREIAYSKKKPLKDLLKEVLTQYAEDNKPSENVPG